MSNRKKLRRHRLTKPVAVVPQLRRMTVRNGRGEDVSWLFGVPPELRGGPRPPDGNSRAPTNPVGNPRVSGP